MEKIFNLFIKVGKIVSSTCRSYLLQNVELCGFKERSRRPNTSTHNLGRVRFGINFGIHLQLKIFKRHSKINADIDTEKVSENAAMVTKRDHKMMPTWNQKS